MIHPYLIGFIFNMRQKKINYGNAIRLGFEHLLEKYPEVFIIGQGLWSPWYVGNSMTDLDKKFGTERVIDTPVSELVCTGAAVGASLSNMKPIIVHPRMDFMLYAMDPIVNQAAKWSHMFGGQSHPGVTIRAIINRGGEQGAQHSQALHSWFAHVPGLRVVMPSSPLDARDLLISSVLCNDPVIYIDDRWLYNEEEDYQDIKYVDLKNIGPKVTHYGTDITIIASGYSSYIARQVRKELVCKNISAEIIDIRVLSPLEKGVLIESVKKTRNFLVLDSGNRFAGYSGELIASIVESIPHDTLCSAPFRIALPDSPAPSSPYLEKIYYPSVEFVTKKALGILKK